MSGAVIRPARPDDAPAVVALRALVYPYLVRGVESPRRMIAEPPLSTVRQPIVELGRSMTRQLLRIAAGETVEQALVLPTELVLRESA